MKRLFIAFDIDQRLRSEVERRARKFMEELVDLRDAVRWIPAERYHMTATFLGETDESRLQQIQEALEEVDLPRRVEMQLGPPLVFPKPRDPRVLVCALQEGAKPLEALNSELRKSLRRREVSFDEKPFRPHLTIGYLRKRPRNILRDVANRWLKEVSDNSVNSDDSYSGEGGAVTQIGLYESVLAPSGPTHTLLFGRPFLGAGAE